MEEDRIKQCLNKYIFIFNVFKSINIITYIQKRLSDSIISTWIYMSLPFILYSINLFFIIHNNVFWNENIKLSYLRDLSNSLCLSILYFISYFLSSYFSSMVEEWIANGIKKNYLIKMPKKQKSKAFFICLLISGIFLLIFGILIGFSFYNIAKSNETKIWSYHLNEAGRIYYCVFLGFTWYQSLSLLGMALSGGAIIFWAFRDNLVVFYQNDYNKNMSVLKAVDILICTFSYGLFYIVGSILFILNDKVAAENGVHNVFSNDYKAFLLVLVVLLIVILVYIPLQELFSFMKKQRKKIISNYNREINKSISQKEKDKLIEKRNDIINQSLIMTSVSNKVIIILSIIIPLIGIIFQGIELFKK